MQKRPRSVLPALSIITTGCLIASSVFAEPRRISTAEKLDKISTDFRSIMSNQGDNIWVNALIIGIALVSFYLLLRWIARMGEYREQDGWNTLQRAEDLRSMGPNSQRRAMLRVPWDGILLYAQSDGSGLDAARVRQEKLYELSGCGLSFITETPPAVGARVMILLDIGLETPLRIKGRVVRADVPPSRLGPGKWVGIEFVSLSLAAQDQIVQWTSQLLRRLVVERRRLEDGSCVRCGVFLKNDQNTSGALCKTCVDAAKNDSTNDWYKAYLRPYSAWHDWPDQRSDSSRFPGQSRPSFPTDRPSFSARPASSIYPSQDSSQNRVNPPLASPNRSSAPPSSSGVHKNLQKQAMKH